MFDKNAKPSPQRQQQLDKYRQLVDRFSPKSNFSQGLLRAFWVGGTICALGQGLTEIGRTWLQMSNQAASTFCSTALVFLTALLTGIGVFDRIGQYAGAGAFVPISGFANAMVSPAMEFRREGMVLGLGAKLFTLAGPVLVWGVSASVIAGLVYALWPMLGGVHHEQTTGTQYGGAFQPARHYRRRGAGREKGRGRPPGAAL